MILSEEQEIIWVAGILEGEGSFLKGPPSNPTQASVRVQMTDKDVIERVASIFETQVGCLKSNNPKWQDSYKAVITGHRAGALMKAIRPYMGVRRKGQIDEALLCLEEHPRRSCYKRWGDQRVAKPRKKILSPDVREEIFQGLQAGESPTHLARKHKVSRQTIYKIKWQT